MIDGFECRSDAVHITGIIPGEYYMAKRNTGWHLLECKTHTNGIVYPVTQDYPYDDYECYLVIN